MKRLNSFFTVILVCLMSTLVGCGPINLVAIYVTPSSADMEIGDTEEFTVRGIYSDGTQELESSATWIFSGDGGTTSPSSGAKTTFTATEEGNGLLWVYVGGLNTSVPIEVEDPDPPPILTRIDISPISWTMNEGTTKDFTATGYDQYNHVFNINPTWSTTGGIGSVSPATGINTTLLASMVSSDTSGTIKATVGLINGSANVTVNNVPDNPVLGQTTMRDDNDYDIPDLGYINKRLHFDTNAEVPTGAVVTKADVKVRVSHTWMADLHIDFNLDGITGACFLHESHESPYTFAKTIYTEWDDLSAKKDVYLFIGDDAAVDEGYVIYWEVTLYWKIP